MQEEGKHMLAQGYGKIINTASVNTVVVLHPEKQIAYNASKAAVAKITQTLGTEWADRGLNVNCISPGIVNTALVQVRAYHCPERLALQCYMYTCTRVSKLATAELLLAESEGSLLGCLAASNTSRKTCRGHGCAGSHSIHGIGCQQLHGWS